MTLAALEQAHLLFRRSFELGSLVTSHPPRLAHPNKQLVYALACPPGSRHQGTLVVARWRSMPLPDALPAAEPERIMREDAFGYEPAPQGASSPLVEWYVNFADANLFFAYGSALFAQDEIQVAEHPALGSLREALLASSGDDKALRPATRDGFVPTPVLIRGAPRHCAIATDPNPGEYRPFGLYGNRFAQGTAIAIRKAVTVLDPPTLTNLIAMEALPGGSGPYHRRQILDVLTTAYTAFRAATVESALAADGPRVVVHTGHWGTGAYGGNKVLMALLQAIAARLAGLSALVYHTRDEVGSQAYREAMRVLDTELSLPGEAPELARLVDAIENKGFCWGMSDGN